MRLNCDYAYGLEVQLMAKCDVCGKGVTFGIKVSHSHRRSNRMWKPNVKRVKAIVDGTPRHVYVCTRCLRSNKVERAIWWRYKELQCAARTLLFSWPGTNDKPGTKKFENLEKSSWQFKQPVLISVSCPREPLRERPWDSGCTLKIKQRETWTNTMDKDRWKHLELFWNVNCKDWDCKNSQRKFLRS